MVLDHDRFDITPVSFPQGDYMVKDKLTNRIYAITRGDLAEWTDAKIEALKAVRQSSRAKTAAVDYSAITKAVSGA